MNHLVGEYFITTEVMEDDAICGIEVAPSSSSFCDNDGCDSTVATDPVTSYTTTTSATTMLSWRTSSSDSVVRRRVRVQVYDEEIRDDCERSDDPLMFLKQRRSALRYHRTGGGSPVYEFTRNRKERFGMSSSSSTPSTSPSSSSSSSSTGSGQASQILPWVEKVYVPRDQKEQAAREQPVKSEESAATSTQSTVAKAVKPEESSATSTQLTVAKAIKPALSGEVPSGNSMLDDDDHNHADDNEKRETCYVKKLETDLKMDALCPGPVFSAFCKLSLNPVALPLLSPVLTAPGHHARIFQHPFILSAGADSVDFAKRFETDFYRYVSCESDPCLTRLMDLPDRSGAGAAAIRMQGFSVDDEIHALASSDLFTPTPAASHIQLAAWGRIHKKALKMTSLVEDQECSGEKQQNRDPAALKHLGTCWTDDGAVGCNTFSFPVLAKTSPSNSTTSSTCTRNLLNDEELRAVMKLTKDGNDASAVFPAVGDERTLEGESDDGLCDELQALYSAGQDLREELASVDDLIKSNSSDLREELVSAGQLTKSNHAHEKEGCDDESKCDSVQTAPLTDSDESDVNAEENARSFVRRVRFTDEAPQEHIYLKECASNTDSKDSSDDEQNIFEEMYSVVEDMLDDMANICGGGHKAMSFFKFSSLYY